ncbi:MAG: N-acetyl-gamma-glutamyl-phosphate reductase [Ekhidna sp.]
MINVGIIGAAGYTAGELIRILIHHPEVHIVLAQSESQAGKKVCDVHRDLLGETALAFKKEFHVEGLDVVFLCKGHGESRKIIDAYPELLECKIVDLSQDFRLKGAHDFVYGLPEIHKSLISKTKHVANPGCFATSIQLGLLPAIEADAIDGNIHVSGITGSTGAGQKLSDITHFSRRSNNASVYKPLEHQHMLETNETLALLDEKFSRKVLFIPYRGAFTRGIITTSHFETQLSEQQLIESYEAFYAKEPYTHVVSESPDLKQVVNTNKCLVYPKVIKGTAMIVSVIDNLLKGASGQAVQNMNLQFGFNETTGLKLKSTAF